jgi:hypothetical protein
MMSASQIQPANGLILDDYALNSAAAELRELDEDILLATIVQPFFERRGDHVENVHNRNEKEHGLDLLIRIRRGNHEILEGVQTKTNKSQGSLTTPTQVRDEVVYKYTRALDYKHPGPGGAPLRLNLLYWITTGDVTSQGWKGVQDHIDNNPALASRIVVWDAHRLIQELVAANCHDLLRSLKLARYKAAKEQHVKQEEGVFAAHCAYLAACRCLESGESGKVESAREYLQEAISLIDRDARRPAYYYRTLFMFYTALHDLLGEFPNAWNAAGLSRSPEITDYLNASQPQGDCFVYATYHCLRQIENLEERYLDHPGLSSLQICNFVLRLGRSPILSSAIAKRIGDAVDEMVDEINAHGDPSVHNRCSLCTGAAASCFSLANLDISRSLCERALTWLRSLQPNRYRYNPRRTTGKPDEHAMHYTALVLIALSDDATWQKGYDGTADSLGEILDLFFTNPKTTPRGFYSEWMTYRTMSEFEICALVFQAFLRVILAQGITTVRHHEPLKKALINLEKRLRSEARDTPDAWRLYTIRENLGSLSLGKIFGVSQVDRLVNEVVSAWHKELCTIYDTPEDGTSPSRAQQARMERLVDSNAVRLRGFLEALMQYWEVEFLLQPAMESSESLVAASAAVAGDALGPV